MLFNQVEKQIDFLGKNAFWDGVFNKNVLTVASWTIKTSSWAQLQVQRAFEL